MPQILWRGVRRSIMPLQRRGGGSLLAHTEGAGGAVVARPPPSGCRRGWRWERRRYDPGGWYRWVVLFTIWFSIYFIIYKIRPLFLPLEKKYSIFVFYYTKTIIVPGVGIEGAEGRAASLAGDVSVRQFAFLARLLLVHGRRSAMRSAALCLFIVHRGLIVSTMQVSLMYLEGAEGRIRDCTNWQLKINKKKYNPSEIKRQCYTRMTPYTKCLLNIIY